MVMLAAGSAWGSVEPMTIRGDKFYVGENEFRIWGFNITRGLHLTDEQYRQNAQRLAFLGVNFVRLHTLFETHWTSGGWPVGVLSPYTQRSTELVNTEGFWRLINSFKEQNICFSINLIKGQRFKPGDSSIVTTDEPDRKAWEEAIAAFPPKASRAHGYLPIFDERAFGLIKEIIGRLLNLRNPRTGVCLKDDPHFALIETVNEGYGYRLIRHQVRHLEMPAYFRNKLIRRWNDYLADKYGSDETLRSAWEQEGKKALLEGETLANRSVDLHPVQGQFGDFSAMRNRDLLLFLTELDMSFQRAMREHYRKLGFGGPSVYGDFNLPGIGSGEELWRETDLCPFFSDHGYPAADLNVFRSAYLPVCMTRVMAEPHPYAWDKPYWRSECGAVHWSRVAYPLYNAVYFSLTGMDGVTDFAWDMNFTKPWYGNVAIHPQEVTALRPIGDIPYQMAFRAAGRLYQSGEIKPLEDVERLRALRSNGDLETDQVRRRSADGILRVETERVFAVAVDHPAKVVFGSAEVDITSDRCNVVVAERVDEGSYEITAVGMGGESFEGTTTPTDWSRMTFVGGTMTLKGKTIEAIIYLDDAGRPIKHIEANGPTMSLTDGVRLYRVVTR